jgi:hypothetical protein
VNSTLTDLPKMQIIRNNVDKLFPSKTYNYIKSDSSSYETSDGIHLNRDEAIKYTSYFKSQIFRIENH